LPTIFVGTRTSTRRTHSVLRVAQPGRSADRNAQTRWNGAAR
jgi:hypothetical protein